MRKRAPVDLESILSTGGAPRVALLQYCVKSVTMEPLFLFLGHEYTCRPTRIAALTLYDMFCAPDALARVRASHALPPYDLRLSAAIERLRREWNDLQSSDADAAATTRLTTPYKNLFDVVVKALRGDEKGPIAELVRRYDPRLDPVENLPGGKMTAGQRQFVDMIWRPRVRPRLVAVGFWQLSSID